MSGPLIWLLAAIVLGAAVMVAHLAVLWVTIRSEVEPRWKWLALVPVLTPVAAWRAERRKAAITWVVFVAAYGVVRLAAG